MKKAWSAGGGPDPATIRRLVEDEGLTDVQIGTMYGVDEATVRYYRKRAGLVKAGRAPRIDHRADGAIPWPLDASRRHHMDPIARMLRSRNKRRHGVDIPPAELRRLEKFEADLAKADLVIDYDPARGFITRSRDPDLDDPDSIVRVPPPPSD